MDGFEMIYKVLLVLMFFLEELMILLLRWLGISEGSLDEIEVVYEFVRELGYFFFVIDYVGVYIYISKCIL